MKLSSPYFDTLLELREGEPLLLEIEAQSLFRKFSEDLRRQADGESGEAVLSVEDSPVPLSRYAEILDCFAPFDINTKSMLTKIAAALERGAVDEEHYLATSALLANIERHITELCFDLPVRIECRKLTAGAVIKAASPAIAEDFASPLEALLSYMSVISDLDRNKLYITVNMRSYFDDEEMTEFIGEIRKKQFHVLLLESSARERIAGLNRLTIDRDLCEF